MNEERMVLCNSGPLIALGKLNRLDLLARLFREIRIPRSVFEEVVTQGLRRGAADAHAVRLFWMRQGWPVDDVSDSVRSAYSPSAGLDQGEFDVLAIARTLKNPLLLMDDEVARAQARLLQLQVLGTRGLIVQSFRRNLLSRSEVELLIQEISARRDIWISSQLCDQILKSLQQD
ncbi:MAG: hypothetical protein V3T83_10035 [Acidobacteriota bacterium]